MKEESELQFIQESVIFQHGNRMSAAWDNKIYTLGGYDIIQAENGSCRYMSSSYISIFYFDEELMPKGTLARAQEMRIPDELPRIKWGSLWADSGKLYLHGGQYEIYPTQETDGDLSNETRTALDGHLWEYDIETNVWAKLIEGYGSTSITPWVTRGMSVFDSTNRIVYILGGLRQNHSSATKYFLGNGTAVHGSKSEVDIGVSLDLTEFSTYDMNTNQWTDFRNNGTLLGPIQQGAMVYIGSLGTTGALIIFGGLTDSATSTPRSMESISIYDINTNSWYNQNATAEDGVFPAGRKEFCAVTVSVLDETSHNIYIWGGTDLNNQSNSLDDMWILTLPYFHWVKIGSSSIGREAMTCDLLWSKYIFASSGRNGPVSEELLTSGPEACDQGIDGGIMIFDITSLHWVHKYNSTGRKHYKVPKRLYDIIGGNADGTATVNGPQGGFSDHKMKGIFRTSSSPDSSTTLPGIPVTEVSSDTTSPTAAIAAGVTVGAVIIIALLLAWLFRRRKLGKKEANTHGGLQDETELDKIADAFGGPSLTGTVKKSKDIELATVGNQTTPAVVVSPVLPAISGTLHLGQRQLNTGKDSPARRSIFEENLALGVPDLGGPSDLEIHVI